MTTIVIDFSGQSVYADKCTTYTHSTFNTPEQAINALKQYGGEEALRNLVEWAPL